MKVIAFLPQIFASFKFYDHFFWIFFVENEKNVYYLTSRFPNFGTNAKLKKLRYSFLQNTLSNVYAHFQLSPLKFDTQTSCLKRPSFNEMQYGENIQIVSCLCVCSECEILK